MIEKELKIVAAGVIIKDGLILLSQRRAHEHLAGNWEFPGGKMKADEDPRDCVKRELMEELGIEVAVESCYDTLFYRYEKFNVLLIFFKCSIVSGTPRSIEVQNVAWFNPRELVTLTMPPADRPLVARLIEETNLC